MSQPTTPTRNHPEIPDSSVIPENAATCKDFLQVRKEPERNFTAADIAALPEGTLFIATGRFAIVPTLCSPVPTRIQETGLWSPGRILVLALHDGRKVFEFITRGSSNQKFGFMLTTPELIDYSKPITFYIETTK